MVKVKFAGSICVPVRKMYGHHKNLRIELRDMTTWEPVAVATVNTDEKMPEDMAYIKDYSENTGVLKSLMDAGVVTSVVGYKQIGYEMVMLAKINLKRLYQEEYRV